jgi:hypothetical protein
MQSGWRTTIEGGPYDLGRLRALVAVVGFGTLADVLKYAPSTIHQWVFGESASMTTSAGTGPFIRWITKEMQLSPIDDIPDRIRGNTGRFAAYQIRSIRQRAAEGESHHSIADDHPVTQAMITMIINRDAYQWVD